MKREIFEAYVDAIVTKFKIHRKELFSKNSRTDLVEARYMLYYLCRNRPMRICHIEEYMNANGYVTGHSNVIAGIRDIQKKIKQDADYVHMVKELEKMVAA